MASSPITSWQIDGEKMETVADLILFSRALKSLWMVTAAMKLKDTCSSEDKLWQLRQHIEKQRHHFANKGLSSQSYGFSISHVQMWELDHREGRVLKNWCFQTVVLQKTLESLLDSKKIKSVNPKGYQPWILIGRNNAEAEAPISWPLDAKSWLTGKDPDAGKDWGQEEKGVTEDEMVGWHYQLNGHAAAAKSLQSCLTPCNPIDGSPPGSSIPGILQARTLEWVAISFSNTWKWKVKVKSLSRVRLISDPMDCSLPGSSVHGVFQARVLEWVAISFSQWTWVWADSEKQWRTGKPGVLQSIGLQRHDLVTEQQLSAGHQAVPKVHPQQSSQLPQWVTVISPPLKSRNNDWLLVKNLPTAPELMTNPLQRTSIVEIPPPACSAYILQCSQLVHTPNLAHESLQLPTTKLSSTPPEPLLANFSPCLSYPYYV